MSETATEGTELASQYASQVSGDLERNLKEQDRIRGEIESFQAQLAALQQDQSVLTNIQQALGVPTTPAGPAAEPAAAVPAPRKKAGAAKQAKAKKSAATAQARSGGEKGAKAATEPSSSPTLVKLVRSHLGGQSEPRSAAEISTALGQQYPERTIKTTVVRTTLEGLVARRQAQRAKQGSSVYYTAPEAADASAPGGEAT
ncbi:hypothetical protein ACWCQP_48725 [Streptomyces chartreusis]